VRTALIPMPLASHLTLKKRSNLGRAKLGAKQSLPLVVSKGLLLAFFYSKFPFFMHSVKEAIKELKSSMNQW